VIPGNRHLGKSKVPADSWDIPRSSAVNTLDIPHLTDTADIQRNRATHCSFRSFAGVPSCMALRSQLLEQLKTTACDGTEDMALTLLAQRHVGPDPTRLLENQLSCGAWGAMPGVDLPNAFHTALALLALRRCQHAAVQGAADRAFVFLSQLRGRESHWLWQWKFRLFDRQVRFDPLKSGWPWVPGTVSWVAPTALAMLAFQAWRRPSARLSAGAGMLLDRACPKGGWNAGNSIAFGVELDPHPDFTAMALLALLHTQPSKPGIVGRALDYLGVRLRTCRSPYTLAWVVLALSAYAHRSADPLKHQLKLSLPSRLEILPARTLGLSALALEEPVSAFQEAVL